MALKKSHIRRSDQKTHIKRGDQVRVLTGKDNGKSGRVLSVMPQESRAIVEGINFVKRHTRPNQQVPQGGIISKEAPVHLSNLKLICPRCHQPTRTGRGRLESGQPVRICKKCGEVAEQS